MKFKKEWTEAERKAVIKVFSKWEPSHLVIPYTSSSSFAMLSNTNVCAELISPILNEKWNFDWLALTENNEVIAGFTDADENEKQSIIGNINI